MIQRGKRKRYPLPKRSHQYRFLSIILIYNLVIVAFLAISLFLPDIIQLRNESLNIEVRAAAADKILAIHSRVWPTVIALICAIGLHSFHVFLRFIGPLYRFSEAFERVGKGDLSFRVKLRKKDYLRDEENELNEMIETLAEKMRSTQLAGLDALKSLGEFEQAITEGSSGRETDKDRLSALRRHLETLMGTVRYFQLKEGEEGQSEGT